MVAGVVEHHVTLAIAGEVGGPEGAPVGDVVSEVTHWCCSTLHSLVDGVLVSASGTPVTYTRTVPLEPQGNTELVVGLRPGDLALSAGDRHVLALVAPLLDQTLRAQALAVDLRASRTHTIAGLEDERRRLRRDLHDGLGPRLSGIAFTADAARNLLSTDTREAEKLLRSLRVENATAIDDTSTPCDPPLSTSWGSSQPFASRPPS